MLPLQIPPRPRRPCIKPWLLCTVRTPTGAQHAHTHRVQLQPKYRCKAGKSGLARVGHAGCFGVHCWWAASARTWPAERETARTSRLLTMSLIRSMWSKPRTSRSWPAAASGSLCCSSVCSTSSSTVSSPPRLGGDCPVISHTMRSSVVRDILPRARSRSPWSLAPEAEALSGFGGSGATSWKVDGIASAALCSCWAYACASSAGVGPPADVDDGAWAAVGGAHILERTDRALNGSGSLLGLKN